MTAISRSLATAVLIAGLGGVSGPALAQSGRSVAALLKPPAPSQSDAAAIVAIVNGDVISKGDVGNRRRLFALSTGMPASPEVLDRLTPQVTHQLIDERLRLQEIQRRKIVVSDKDIADAIGQIEARNNMPAGTLRRQLESVGVEFRTLVDQVRVQIGWKGVLRQVLAGTGDITPADIADQERLFKEQIGKPEYQVSEIFVPVASPAATADAQKFADTVIQQLRTGAPFPVVAAQFSQSQTALQGGDLGWEEPNQLDPAVLKVINEMPVGAVSNPIKIPGGFSIVQLRGKREIGRDESTVLHLRQVFFPFTTRLDPANPTAQQKQMLDRAKDLSATAKSCDAIEEANKAAGSARPTDPGEIRLEQIASPPLKQVLSSLSEGKPSQPLVAEDGIAVVMVCSRETKNVGLPSKEELADRILGQRVELASQQLIRDLERKAVIDLRS
ncbi:MAG TPA: peptidylprolyl isomerase [Acetobacteraceae bacterium]|jgi:peptidyl-prolyl cis-trans isomerase SurA|nr:peptidylprolyl isomerase [Acetobacteraceae bacterium]